MKTIVEALQDLYVALGGEKADVSGLKLNPDVIEQIAALVNAGALNELPAVTSEDAGDVLTVDNSGKWGAAAPSGGSSLPSVTNADIGDVLTVIADVDVIIPEQTVVVDDSSVQLQDTSAFLAIDEETQLIMRVNGTDYTGTYNPENEYLIVSFAEGKNYTIRIEGESVVFSAWDVGQEEYIPGSYTVSLLHSTGNAKWDKAAPSGGGVLVATFNTDTGKFDKTYTEIKVAFLSSGVVCSFLGSELWGVVNVTDGDTAQNVPYVVGYAAKGNGNEMTLGILECDSADDYVGFPSN